MIRYFFYFLLLLFINACVPVVGVSTIGIIKTGVEVADDPRSLGRIVDDSVIEKSFYIKFLKLTKNIC